MMYSTGRRKTSSARVFMRDGKGDIFINNMLLNKYFTCKIKVLVICQPFNILKDVYDFSKYNFYITVKGGGISSQSIAIRHGISRLLLKYNNSFRCKLRYYGFITRDSREVERKKYGLRKARCRPQYSKR